MTKADNIYCEIRNSIIGKKETSRNVIYKISKTVYLSTLLKGSETWVKLDKQKSRITSSEMKYLRSEGKQGKKERIR